MRLITFRATFQRVHSSPDPHICQDNETVVRMCEEGRNSNLTHVSRTDLVDFDWLFERINLDCSISIRCVRTTEQLADMLTGAEKTRNRRDKRVRPEIVNCWDAETKNGGVLCMCTHGACSAHEAQGLHECAYGTRFRLCTFGVLFHRVPREIGASCRNDSPWFWSSRLLGWFGCAATAPQLRKWCNGRRL